MAKKRKHITMVLENDNVILNKRIQQLLDFKFRDTDLDIWTNFGIAFFSNNKEKSMARFFKLRTGDNIVVKTTLDELSQLEAMIKVLMKFKEKGICLNIYVDCKPFFGDRLNEYLKVETSFYTEHEDLEKRKEEKKIFNELAVKVINYHKVFQMSMNYYVNEEGWRAGVRRMGYDYQAGKVIC